MSDTDRRIAFADGRAMWQEYVRVNGYAWKPTDAGLSKLARILDLRVSYIRQRINTFLEA